MILQTIMEIITTKYQALSETAKEHGEAAIKSPAMQGWLNKMSGWVETGKYKMGLMSMMGVKMFGKNAGFTIFEAPVTDLKHNNQIPSFVTMRENTCATVVIVKIPRTNKHGVPYYELKTMAVKQFRVPAADFVVELPAGVIDPENMGRPAKAMVKELKEELGLTDEQIASAKLTPLIERLPHLAGQPRHTNRPLFLSPGGSTEQMWFYMFEIELTPEQAASFDAKKTGEVGHGEIIETMILDFNEGVLTKTDDAKTFFAWASLLPFRDYLSRRV